MTKSRSRKRAEHRALFSGSRAQPLRLARKSKYFLLTSDVLREPALSMIAVGVDGQGCGRPNEADQSASGLRCCGPRSVGAEGLRGISPTDERGLHELASLRPLLQPLVFEPIWSCYAALYLKKLRSFSSIYFCAKLFVGQKVPLATDVRTQTLYTVLLP